MSQLHNLTVFSMADQKGYCYMWIEVEGQRGSIKLVHVYTNTLNLFSGRSSMSSYTLTHVLDKTEAST